MAAVNTPNQPKYETKATRCSTLEERPEFAPLPNPADKHYLQEKARYSLKAPRKTVKLLRGKEINVSLYQITCTLLIRAEEYLTDFHWPYKAEVSFDMTSTVPRPFLSTSENKLSAEKPDPGRRHSLNPFPPGHVPGFLRRPDVILVRSAADRWPGRATTDHEGIPHGDNIERVVEMKFPGDTLSTAQREAYLLIAGGGERFSVLDIAKCDDDEDEDNKDDSGNGHAPSTQPNGMPHVPPILPPFPPRGGNEGPAPAPVGPQPSPQPETQPVPLLPGVLPLAVKNGASRVRAPVYSTKPLHDPAWYERLGDEAAHLRDEIASAMSRLSAEMQAQVRQLMPWLREAGQWVRDKAHDAWVWVDEKGHELGRWTLAQLKAAMKTLMHECDLAWEDIKRIEWGQMLLQIGKVVGVVLLIAVGAIVAVVVCMLLAEVLATVLAALAMLAAGVMTLELLVAA